MRSSNPFIREIACLHGLGGEARHAGMMEVVFDEDEAMALDAVDQLQRIFGLVREHLSVFRGMMANVIIGNRRDEFILLAEPSDKVFAQSPGYASMTYREAVTRRRPWLSTNLPASPAVAAFLSA